MLELMKRIYRYRGIDIVMTPSVPPMFLEKNEEVTWKWYLRIPLDSGNTVCLDLVGWNGHDPILGVVHSRTGITRTTDESINKAKAAIDYIIAHSPDRNHKPKPEPRNAGIHEESHEIQGDRDCVDPIATHVRGGAEP